MKIGRSVATLCGFSLFALTACAVQEEEASGNDEEAIDAGDAADPLGEAAQSAAEGEIASADCGASATIFACTTTGGMELRVCRAEASDGTAYAQYRFGPTSGAPELVLPEGEGTGAQWASVPYSGGGEAQIRFANGSTEYIVYSRVVRTGFDEGGNNPEFSDGVIVRNGDAVAANIGCDGEPERAVDVNALMEIAESEDELFTW